MLNFSFVLTGLQAAIAVVAAREQHLTVLLVAVWGRIGRIHTRLARLIALWRAGMLPKPRKSRAGETQTRTSTRATSALPTVPAWLLVAVREAAPYGTRLEHLLSQDEYVEFLAACPQAGRILRPLCRMLGVGVKARTAARPRAIWRMPKAAPVPVQAGLAVGPGGRLMWV